MNKLPLVQMLQKRSFQVRLISALILISIALAGVFAGGYFFTALAGLFGAFMLVEWKNISDPNGKNLPHILNGFALVTTVLLTTLGHITLSGIVLFSFVFLNSLERARRGGAWRAGFGLLYLLLPVLLLLLLRDMHGGLGLMLFIFTVVWAADSGAYLLGSIIRGPKLWPEISPNKTWSGFFGGIFLGTVSGAVLAISLGRDPVAYGGLAFVLTIVAAGGDLLISRMKRHFGVKDTGDTIPGHGGVIDRMDAFLAAVLVCSALIYEFPGIWGRFL
ncbi:Phosphatidate cytidylyltransferase [hydrothermal vent metagenome]|uniref:Phosphatidate cytidylyltransferase n=1 Tax=hydrothermal vent metagenome TaxID=652676 RepID=A0A3B0RNM7_9ZZZZ